MSKNLNALSFKPAALFEGKETYVEFYYLDPETEKMIRKRYKLNRIKNKAERTRYAKNLISELNKKLYDGWIPLYETSSSKSFQPLLPTFETYFTSKSKELRADSLRSYRSFLDKMIRWVSEHHSDELLIIKFTPKIANEFMTALYLDPTISNGTWNNHLLFYRSLWNWMIEHQYSTINVFDTFTRKQKEKKERVLIPEKERTQLKEYLETHDYDFLIVTMLVFHCLLRPKEISMLKPNNFNLKNQIIHVPAAVSKNRTSRQATIPNELMPYLVSWNFNNATSNQFIWSPDLNPGTTPICSRRWSKKWDVMRKQLKWPMTMKLYSLRDSGIIQLLQDGISPEEVMIHADHHSLEITSIYVKHAKPNGSAVIKNRASKF